MDLQGVLQTLHAEPALQCIRDTPCQHIARVLVDHRYQIRKSLRHADVGDGYSTPN